MESHIDKDKAIKSIALILDKLKTEADIQALEEYRSVFKKEVSVFNRSWAAAYLLMNFDQGNTNFRGNFRNRGSQQDYRSNGSKLQSNTVSSDRTNERNGEERPRQYTLAEEESKRIFISIGRKRRVFPREILGLIIAKTGVSREDIGMIRIFDNYSFVQVRDVTADLIINSLDGYIFRGRTLVVNYAKARKDEEASADNQDDSFSFEEEEMPAASDDFDAAEDKPDADEDKLDADEDFSEQGQD